MLFYLIKNPDLPVSKKQALRLDEIITERGFTLIKLNDFDIINAAREGVHIITVGFIGLTNFSAVCQFAFGIDQNEQFQLIQPVNTKKETGTLYPKYRLTILPYRYLTTPGITIGEYDYTGGKGFSDNEVRTHLEDALKAEINYIKSGKIVFDFFHLGEDMVRYSCILLDLLTTDERYKSNDWECYMYSVYNSEWE